MIGSGMKFIEILEKICKKCIEIHIEREEKYGDMRTILHPIVFASVIEIKAKRLFNLLLDFDAGNMDRDERIRAIDDQVYDIINYLVFLYDRVKKVEDEKCQTMELYVDGT